MRQNKPPKTPSITFACSTCGAEPGEPCRSVSNRSIRSLGNSKPPMIRKFHPLRVACCYRAPMARLTACLQQRYGNDTDDWTAVTCSECLKRQPELAAAYARYVGTEFEATPGSSLGEYLDDCASSAWGVERFMELTLDKKGALRKAFDEGRAAEREARRR